MSLTDCTCLSSLLSPAGSSLIPQFLTSFTIFQNFKFLFMNLFKFTYGIRDKVLERRLETKITRMEDNAKQDTGIAVSQNLTNPQVILTEVAAETDVLKEEVTKTLNPEIGKLTEEIEQTDLEALQSVAKGQEEQLNHKISALEVDIKRTTLDFDFKKLIWTMVAIVALCSIDAGANYSSFQVIAKNLLGAIMLAIAVAIALSSSAHTIGMKIRTASSTLMKRLWFFGGLAGAGVVFYFLGMIRQEYTGKADGFANSPLLWMCFNLFFFAVALLLAATKFPTKEQRLAYVALQDKKKQLASLKNEKETLLNALRKEESRINECRQKLEAFLTYRAELLSSLDKEKERINAMCLKEFELKGGKIATKVSFTSKNNKS
ncbi:MAG TPA: hypothetical protein PLJ00_03300 [Chitinophagales bacterium]|nr:hypothetical protein [Chitinophagales bacterium]HRG26893.1 hypothetical protein [Chitinophagales bacterium]HRG85217.1 hypothetical protein [Chitinophagales bacterium]HRH51813.1 hypothetical protein [Chitinophagales bacterium]